MNNKEYNIIKNLAEKKEHWIPTKIIKSRLKKDGGGNERINKLRLKMQNKISGK